MPPSPEFRDGFGAVGVAKVLREGEAQDFSKADGHVAVPGEVKIDVQGEGQGVDPVKKHALALAGPEGPDERTELVGQQDFFAQADQKTGKAFGKIVPTGIPAVQLGGNVGVTDDGPGDELGEHGNVGAEFQQIFLDGYVPTVHVNHIALLLLEGCFLVLPQK